MREPVHIRRIIPRALAGLVIRPTDPGYADARLQAHLDDLTSRVRAAESQRIAAALDRELMALLGEDA